MVETGLIGRFHMKDAAAENLQKTIASSEPEFVNLLSSPGIDS
jgi:hypothetical protein